jgi:hemerythrin-like domain-containing protein
MALLRSETAEFWKGELKPHFEAEEAMARDLAAHVGASDGDITRLVSDHRSMEQLVQKGFKEDLLRFADLLKTHIRFEEDRFFGRLERTLSPGEIQKAGEKLMKLGASSCQVPGPGTDD